MSWNTTTDKKEKAYKEALDKCRILASQNPEIYTPRVASILNNLGVFYSDTQKLSEAEKVYKEALQIRRALAEKNPNDYTHDVAVTLNNLGILYNDTQRFFEAEKTYKEALKIKKALMEHPEDADPDIAMILLNLGALYNDTQKFSRAEKVYKEALQIYRELTKKNNDVYADIVLTLNNLGALHIYTQRFDEAENAFIEALQIRKTLAEENPEVHTPDIAMILNNLGILYISTQKFSEAEKVYNEALQIRRALAEQNPDVYTPHVAATLNSVGNLYNDTTQFDEAEKAYTEALQKYRALVEKTPEVYAPHVAATLDNLGSLYTHSSKFSEAEKAYIEALQIRKILAKENPEVFNPDVALTLNNLGNLYTSTHKFFEAEKAYTDALQIRRTLARQIPEVHTPDIAMTLNNLGNVYSDINQFDKAESALIEALQIRKTLAEENPEVHTPDIAMILTNLGNLYKDIIQFDKAEKAFIEALQIRKTLAEENPEVFNSAVASTLDSLGSLYKDVHDADKAEKAFIEAIQKYKQATLWFDTARSTYNLFTVTFDGKTLENSKKLLELAILLSKEKRYKYAQKGRHENIYVALLHMDISTFGVLEALRDPELLSLPWDKTLLQQELKRAQSDMKFQKALIEKILNEHVPYFGHIPGTLPENALFIYVQELLDYVLFYVIKGDSSEKFKCRKEFLAIGDKLLRNLRIQRGAAQKTDNLAVAINKFEMYSKKWSEMLPDDIRRLIQENDQIVFSPDSYCSSLPLEALQIDGEYLCIEKTVVRAASFHQFLTLLGKKPSLDSSLIMGNPWPQCDEKKLIYSLPSKPEYFRIPSLQNAQEEAKVLTKKLPNGTVLLGQNATGERFLSEISKHSLIHFSGHGDLGRILFLSGPFKGFPPPFEPEEFSDLRKAERIKGTKKINMMEEWHPVTDLDLFDVPLVEGTIVFLNACETGQHKYAGGGYYQGLPAVFLKNGAHSVISSLVPIFDEHSKEFAIKFYEILLHTHSVSESLKKARIWAKSIYKAQIYWIPYLHYGPPS